MKRPVLSVCTSCRTDDAWDGRSFFDALKARRAERGLKPLFKLKEADCLSGCDTPCNAQLYGKGRPTLDVTWLQGGDVEALLDGACRYAEARRSVTHLSLQLPGRAAPGSE
jgi:predicted metal-binding protein